MGAAVWTVVFTGCEPQQATGRPVPTPVANDVRSECRATCQHIDDLKCLGDYPLDACENMCTRVKSSGYLELPTACALSAKSAIDLEKCGITCEQ